MARLCASVCKNSCFIVYSNKTVIDTFDIIHTSPSNIIPSLFIYVQDTMTREQRGSVDQDSDTRRKEARVSMTLARRVGTPGRPAQ